MTSVEIFYLFLGTAILAHEILITGTLTPTELGAALFFFGLVPVSRADRKAREGKGYTPEGVLRNKLRTWIHKDD